jgi:hypothetical protein
VRVPSVSKGHTTTIYTHTIISSLTQLSSSSALNHHQKERVLACLCTLTQHNSIITFSTAKQNHDRSAHRQQQQQQHMMHFIAQQAAAAEAGSRKRAAAAAVIHKA